MGGIAFIIYPFKKNFIEKRMTKVSANADKR